MASAAIAARGTSQSNLQLHGAYNPVRGPDSYPHSCAFITPRGRVQAPLSITSSNNHHDFNQVWRLASSLTSAYFPTDDDEVDENEYYVQYKQHKRKVVRAALKILDGQCIFLTGMMGSGKSTIGEILAQQLKYGFVDSDELVVKFTGCDSVADIFAQKGEEGFRDAESRALHMLCNGIAKLRRPVVVALGGGAVLKPENWVIAKHGIVVYIDVPSEILAKRIVAAGTHSRPLFPPRCSEFKAQKLLQTLYNQREDTYNMARIRVPIKDLSTKLRLKDASTIPPALVAFEVLKKIEKLGAPQSLQV